MLEKGKISQGQFLILALLYVIGTSILIGPSLFVAVAAQNAWFATLIGIGIGLFQVFLYGILAKRYPDSNLIEFNESIVGKWAGKAISLLFFFYFLILTSGLLRILDYFIITTILTDTPIQAINITFMLLIIFGVRIGLEPFSRTSQMVFPWVLLFLFLLICFLLPEIKIENVSPFLEDGIKPVIKASIISLGVPFSDLVIFLMISPYVAKPKKIGRALLIATLSGGILLLVIVLLSILVLGHELVGRLNYPIYVLAQKVNIGNFIQRIEVLAGGIVFISIFVKIIISFYSTVLSFAHIFQLKIFETLTFPLGIIVIILSMLMFPNIVFFNYFLATTWPLIVLIFGLVFPIILIIVDTIKVALRKKITE